MNGFCWSQRRLTTNCMQIPLVLYQHLKDFCTNSFSLDQRRSSVLHIGSTPWFWRKRRLRQNQGVDHSINPNHIGAVTGIDAMKKLDEIEPLVGCKPGASYEDRAATQKKMTACPSPIGKGLYIGRLVSPSIVFYASQAAKKWKYLRQHHKRAPDTIFQTAKSSSWFLIHLLSYSPIFMLKAISDAFLNTQEDGTDAREGILTFQRSGDVLHAISCISGLASKAECSTSTASYLLQQTPWKV